MLAKTSNRISRAYPQSCGWVTLRAPSHRCLRRGSSPPPVVAGQSVSGMGSGEVCTAEGWSGFRFLVGKLEVRVGTKWEQAGAREVEKDAATWRLP